MAWNSLKSYHIVNAASMGASVTSAAQAIQFQDNVGFELVWTGAPVGQFYIEMSINYDPLNGVTGNWVNLPLSSAIIATGAGDSAYIEINQLSAPWIRVVYTRTSGTGTLDVWVAAKGV